MKYFFKPRQDNTSSANPFRGWPNPDGVSGTMPQKPVFEAFGLPVIKDGLVRDDTQSIPPLIVGVGPNAASSIHFCLSQQASEIKKGVLYHVLLFSHQEAKLKFPEGITVTPLIVCPHELTRSSLQKQFIQQVNDISIKLDEIAKKDWKRIIVVIDCQDNESGFLGVLLYLFRTLNNFRGNKIELIASTPEGQDIIPGINNYGSVLLNLRELHRLSCKGEFRIKDLPAKFDQYRSEEALVNQVYCFRSFERGSNSDVEQMAEFLSAILEEGVHNLIEQEILNTVTAFSEKKNTEWLINDVCCASLYMPISEHMEYLHSALVKELLFGQSGFFKESSNLSAQSQLNSFVLYPEYKHGFFDWLLDKNQDCPPISPSAIPGYLALFKKRVNSYINHLFLEHLSIQTAHNFLEELGRVLVEKKSNLYSMNQENFSKLVEDCENHCDTLKNSMKIWLERAGVPRQVLNTIPIVALTSKPIPSTRIPIEDFVENNLKRSVSVLHELAQKKYSIPVIDGTIAHDRDIREKIYEIVKNGKISKKIFWWLDENDNGINLHFGDVAIPPDFSENEFWKALESISRIQISDLLHINNTQFSAEAQDKADQLKVIKKRAFAFSDISTYPSVNILRGNSESLCQENKDNIFEPHEISNLRIFPRYTYSRLTAINLDMCRKINSLSDFDNLFQSYITMPEDHAEIGEKTAFLIEKFLYHNFSMKRLLSPLILFSLQENERSKLFFESWLSGVSQRIITQDGNDLWRIGNDIAADIPISEARSGGNQLDYLTSLCTAYSRFTTELLPNNIKVEDIHNPYHINNWSDTQERIKCLIEENWNRRTVTKPLIDLLAAEGIVSTERRLRSDYRELLKSLLEKEKGSPLKGDIVSIIFYYWLNGMRERGMNT